MQKQNYMCLKNMDHHSVFWVSGCASKRFDDIEWEKILLHAWRAASQQLKQQQLGPSRGSRVDFGMTESTHRHNTLINNNRFRRRRRRVPYSKDQRYNIAFPWKGKPRVSTMKEQKKLNILLWPGRFRHTKIYVAICCLLFKQARATDLSSGSHPSQLSNGNSMFKTIRMCSCSRFQSRIF